jgi:sialate O-acetylesterase
MAPERIEPGSAQDWLRHARSDLALAGGSIVAGVIPQTLCFHAQQASEKAIKTALVVVVMAVLAAAQALAVVKPNALFSDGMVLQRGVSVSVWGTADDGEHVSVSFAKQAVSTTAENGKWMVRLEPSEAGGPFSMTIAGKNVIVIRNVMVGEAWVCSGQSNMELPLSAAADSEQTIAGSADPLLRLFTVPRSTAPEPTSDISAAWQVCGPESVRDFSAVGYFFGRELRRTLGVPVGLIDASVGGTIAEAWTSRPSLGAQADPTLRAAIADPAPFWAQGWNAPSGLYNGMIAPLQPYGIRGAIWYQGESNAFAPGQSCVYKGIFAGLIADWRAGWNQGDFPFLFVQLAPFDRVRPRGEDANWAEVRDGQLWVSRNVPHTAMAVIMDAGDPNDIHPRDKKTVGERLALAARGVAYGEDIVYQGPVCESMTVDGDRATLTFSSIGGGLVADGGELKGFAIAGKDHVFHPAQASIDGDTVVVRSPDVPEPVAVRYAWRAYPAATLCNREGIPASPFRTDNGDIVRIDPPESGFFAKRLDYHGISIKAAEVVCDEALYVARDRLQMMLGQIPDVAWNLAQNGVELHIIGKEQVTSDLPEHRHMKGKPYEGNLTIDERTRGVGGQLVSCGEENLLCMPQDRYRGRDICLHEFAHAVDAFGLSDDVRKMIEDQYKASLAKGLWKTAYAGTNKSEYFAELTMWYFHTTGDTSGLDPKPERGRDALRKYDPEGFDLLDRIYTGKIPTKRIQRIALTPLPVGRESEMKSGDDGVATSIQFINHTAAEIQFHWLDTEGKRRQYGTIPPHGRAGQSTFAGHVWLITDADGKGIAIFVASADPGVAVIEPPGTDSAN